MALRHHIRHWQDRARDPALTVLLIVQLIAMFVLTPVAAMGLPISPFLVDIILIVVITVVLAITSSRSAIVLALLAVAISVGAAALRVMRPSVLDIVIGHLGTILGLTTLTWVVSRAVFARGRVTIHRVQGAVVLYLNFAMIFTAAYRLVFELSPDAFRGIEVSPTGYQGNNPHLLATMLYFSFTTLTSTGFGDIVPIHPIARSLANLEAIIGQLYPATLLARVVTLELQFRRAPRHRDG